MPMTIDPAWIVVAFVSAVFVIGFLIGYALGRLEANKLFDLRDQNIQLRQRRDYWQARYEDQIRYTDELRERYKRDISDLTKEDSESEKTT
jgi:hypothetical protein